MKPLIFLLGSLFVVTIAHAETQRERNCRATFESVFQWNDGSPKERYWDQKCRDYVKKSGGEWKWVGDAESRRIAEEKKRKEEEEKKRLSEKAREKKEEQLRKQEEQTALLIEEVKKANNKREWLNSNYKTLSFGELENSIRSVRQEKTRLKAELDRSNHRIKSVEPITPTDNNWINCAIGGKVFTQSYDSCQSRGGQPFPRTFTRPEIKEATINDIFWWCVYSVDNELVMSLKRVQTCKSGVNGKAFKRTSAAKKEFLALTPALIEGQKFDLKYQQEVLNGTRLARVDWPNIANHYLSTSFNDEITKDGPRNPLDALSQSVQNAKALSFSSKDFSEAPRDLVFLVRASADSQQKPIEGEIALGANKTLSFLTQPVDRFLQALEVGEKTTPIAIFINKEEPIREVSDQVTVESQYVSDSRRIPNDEYYRLSREVADWKSIMIRPRSKHCRNVGLLFYNKCVNDARKNWQIIHDKYQSLRKRLDKTPSTLLEPIYSQYAFKKTTISISKQATLEVLVVDSEKDSVTGYSYPVVESDKFTVLHGITESDKNYKTHLRNTVTDKEIGEWEENPMKVDLLALATNKEVVVEEFGTREEFLQSLNKKEEIVEEATEESTTTQPVETSDSRFDSVVIVLHPSGGIGTGFYIDEETVLTNYHVVEGSQFHEIGLFDGSDTFGKVYAKNIALDLALIKVQKRGVPVKFYPSNKLPVGATVDAIGHPQGLEYSLTRGTISGIRRMASLYDPGGKPVRFIQSDVAINPGNSGGPLFIGGKVVGVNDWKLADTDLEGLSFSIHISEVKKFLEKHGF